ncbi:site-specific integrase [Streptomyces flavidovirens]|uniref:site-specific integrase n=1 Tax=Streptomyces flavidovirens TaxID=67298 RepID=UPI0036AC755A
MDSLAVRHRPATPPPHRPPHLRPAVPHRPQGPAGTPTLDACPEAGRARLSYRRAEEIFEENTRLLANPLASPDDIEDLDGWTLHRLGHSALTHYAEDGTSTPMLLARSRHASVRSLERYARPGVDSVARHVAERDPAARRRT